MLPKYSFIIKLSIFVLVPCRSPVGPGPTGNVPGMLRIGWEKVRMICSTPALVRSVQLEDRGLFCQGLPSINQLTFNSLKFLIKHRCIIIMTFPQSIIFSFQISIPLYIGRSSDLWLLTLGPVSCLQNLCYGPNLVKQYHIQRQQ